MKKADLLKRIEELERRIGCLEARPYVPYQPIAPYVLPGASPTIPVFPWVTTCQAGPSS